MRLRSEMRDDLVPEEIEIHPVIRAAALGTAQQLAVKGTRGGNVVDRKGEVERGQGHRARMPCRPIARPKPSIGAAP